MAGICDTCHAGCCRSYELLITVYDALVIARDLSLPPWEFTTLLALPEDKAMDIEKGRTAIKFSDPGLEGKSFVLSLKRVESSVIPGTRKCYFLLEWERKQPIPERGDHFGSKIAGRCGIYGSRPLMCSVFPTVLAGAGEAIGYVGTPNNPNPVHEAYRLCPDEWTSSAFSSNPTSTIHNLAVSNYEKNYQAQILSEWNSNPGLMQNFFDVMEKAYANRFRHAEKPQA